MSTRTTIAVDVAPADEVVPKFIGEVSRVSSCTDAAFLGRRTVLIAHLTGHRLQIWRRSLFGGRWKIINQISATAGDSTTRIDLVDADRRRRIVVSNCRNRSVGIYSARWNRLRKLKDIELDDVGAGFTHGAAWVPAKRPTVCVSNSGGDRRLRFFDERSGELLMTACIGEWRPKQVAFLDEHTMVAAFAIGEATVGHQESYDGCLMVFDLDLEACELTTRAEVRVPKGHVDTCVVQGNDVYVNDQVAGVVHRFSWDGSSLHETGSIDGFRFPHGLAVRGRTLVVTNYGDSTFDLVDLDEFEARPEGSARPLG